MLCSYYFREETIWLTQITITPFIQKRRDTMYKKILVPLDGSKRAERILPHVEDLAGRYGAKVLFLMSLEYTFAAGVEGSFIEFSEKDFNRNVADSHPQSRITRRTWAREPAQKKWEGEALLFPAWRDESLWLYGPRNLKNEAFR
jgi:hypothetical protein